MKARLRSKLMRYGLGSLGILTALGVFTYSGSFAAKHNSNYQYSTTVQAKGAKKTNFTHLNNLKKKLSNLDNMSGVLVSKKSTYDRVEKEMNDDFGNFPSVVKDKTTFEKGYLDAIRNKYIKEHGHNYPDYMKSDVSGKTLAKHVKAAEDSGDHENIWTYGLNVLLIGDLNHEEHLHPTKPSAKPKTSNKKSKNNNSGNATEGDYLKAKEAFTKNHGKIGGVTSSLKALKQGYVDYMNKTYHKHYTDYTQAEKDGHETIWQYGIDALNGDIQDINNQHKKDNKTADMIKYLKHLEGAFGSHNYDFNIPSAKHIHWYSWNYFTKHLEAHNNLGLSQEAGNITKSRKLKSLIYEHYKDNKAVSTTGNASAENNYQAWNNDHSWNWNDNHNLNSRNYVKDITGRGNLAYDKYDHANWKDQGFPSGDQDHSSTISVGRSHGEQMVDNAHLGYGTSDASHKIIRITFGKNNMPSKKASATIKYKDAAIMNNKPVDIELKLSNITPFTGKNEVVPYRQGQKAWQSGDSYKDQFKDGSRSIGVSKDAGKGIYLNGILSCNMQYRFYQAGTNNLVHLNPSQVVGVNSLDGIDYQKKYDANHNIASWAGPETSSMPYWDNSRYITQRPKYIPRNYYNTEDYVPYHKSLVGKYANFYDDNGSGQLTSSNHILGELPNAKGNQYTFKTTKNGVKGRFPNQYYKGISNQLFRNIASETVTKSKHDKPTIRNIYRYYDVNGGRRDYGTSGGFYNNDVNDEGKSTSNFSTHSVFSNHLPSDNVDVDVGCGNGYGNFSLRSDIPHSKSEITYACDGSNSKSGVKIIKTADVRGNTKKRSYPLSNFVGKNSKYPVSRNMFFNSSDTKLVKSSYDKLTVVRKGSTKKSTTRAFASNADAIKWTKTIGCITNPKPKEKKITTVPTPHSTKPIKYLGSGVYHTKYDKETDEGILRHPEQKYWYHITGLMPERHYYNKATYWYWYYKGQTYKFFGGYVDGYTSDNYHVSDDLPSYVTVIGHPTLNVGGDTIQNSGSGNHVQFDLDKSQMDEYSRDQYTANIHVKANHLPEVKKAGWLTYFNGGSSNSSNNSSTDVHAYGTIYGSGSDRYSNKVPVKIKKIEDNIYYYDYNHSENEKDNFFPESELATGVSDKCGSKITNPNSKYYKPYQFNKYFAKGNVSDNNGKTDKTHSVLAVKHHFGYVGSVYGAQSIDQNKDNDANWHYRTVYPTFSKPNLPKLDYNNYKDTLNGQFKKGLFNKEEKMLGSKLGLQTADELSSNKQYIPIIMNSSACGSSYNTGDNDFTENTYLPYLVPRITFLPKYKGSSKTGKQLDESKNGQLIIDTDTDKHGLPFRFNMRSMNFLYDSNYYYKDFAGDKVTMKIKSGDNTGTTIYKATRPLIGKTSNNAALSRRGYHAVKKDEFPAGDDGQWHGYIEKHALDHAWSDYANSYNSQHGTNLTGGQMRHRYALNIQKAYSPSDIKARQDDNNYSLPIRVTFKLTNPSKDRVTFGDLRNMRSHAYTAADPQINNSSFGHNDVIKQGSRTDNPNNDANRATFIAPERTIKYYEGNANDDEDKDVRELNELLSVNQPRRAVGKTGFGMTGNDLGITYLGHLEASQYAHTGTNMRYAFPHDFASHNTKMTYDSDRRHPSMLGDVMMHVQPNNIPTDSDGLGENDSLPKELDTDDVTDDNSDVGQADDYYQEKFPQELHAGNFSTTYGFYPREATHNIRTNQNSGDNTTYNNGGDITVAKNSSEATGYHSHSHYDDPTIQRAYGKNPLDKERGYGMHGNYTYNNDNSFTHHTISIKDNGENEAMFTPYFMSNGTYPTFFERVFYHSRAHRLGGNFIDIDEGRPVKFYAHMMISKGSDSTDNDEFSMQPILSNTKHGLSQTPDSSPLFPDDWLSGADDKMSPNWFDALIKTNGHSKDLGEHDNYNIKY